MLLCFLCSIFYFILFYCLAVTKSGTGTWDLRTRGHGDVGTRGLGDEGTWGLRDVVREVFGTRRRAGIRGRDKQITPDFCADLVKYFF